MESYRQRFDDAPSKINNEQEKSVLVTKNSGVSGNSLVFGADKEVMFGNLLNADCILLPHCGTSSSHQKLWSQALLANRISSSAEVGLIESHGSLWRFVPFVEGDNSRVILQNSV